MLKMNKIQLVYFHMCVCKCQLNKMQGTNELAYLDSKIEHLILLPMLYFATL